MKKLVGELHMENKHKEEKILNSENPQEEGSVTDSASYVEKIIEETEKRDNQKKLSIYLYLKSNPTVLIALISACVAGATFIAKISAANSMKMVLMFWGFDLSYLNYENSSLLFSALMSFLYIMLIGFVSLWNQSCQQSLIPLKKHLYESKTLLKKMNSKKEHAKDDEKNNIEQTIDSLCLIIKAGKRDFRFYESVSILITFIVTFFAVFLEQSVTNKTNGWKFWLSIFLMMIIQFASLKALTVFSGKTAFSKKKIKKQIQFNSTELSLNIKKQPICNINHPLFQLHNEGVRSFFDNTSIILCAVLIMLNCIAVCIIPFANTKKYSWQNDTYRIVELGEESYVIVLQDNNRYYLERAEVAGKSDNAPKDKDEQVLNVYINEQRVIETNDISYKQQTFDTVVKIESGEKIK